MSKTRQILWCLMPFVGIIFLGVLPLLIMMLGGWIGSLLGVHVNEANPPDIPIVGGLLYGMYVIGWLALGTIPLAACAFVAYSIVFVVRVVRILRQHQSESVAANDDVPTPKHSDVVEKPVSRRRFLGGKD